MDNKNLELLQYQIKLLHTMVTSMDDFSFHFHSFVIDHNISEEQTKTIMQGLMYLKDRLNYGKVTDEYKTLQNENESLKVLDKDFPPSFSDFSQFINSLLGKEINAEYLLKSLIMQSINKDLCQFILDNKN